MDDRSARYKLAVGRLWHEGNHFSPLHTTVQDFQHREWVTGPKASQFYRQIAVEPNAAVKFSELHPQWTVEFIRCASAPPGGPLGHLDYEMIRDEMIEGLRQSRWDAVYLSLHGAMAVDDLPQPETDLLRHVRQVIGDAVLGVSLDFHANIGDSLFEYVDFVTGYRTYPHIDMVDTAARCLAAISQQVDGDLPRDLRRVLIKIPAILPSMNMRTDVSPMNDLQQAMDKLRHQPGIVDASLFGGFAYGDSPDAGPSILVYGTDMGVVNNGARAMADRLLAATDQFYTPLPSPAEAIRKAMTTQGGGTIAITDPGDNPLSGGIGDTTGLLQEIANYPTLPPTVFAFFFDPDLVDRCHAMGTGAKISARLGARLSRQFGRPIPFEATIAHLTDGRFTNTGPMEQGMQVNLGRTAVLKQGNLSIVITATCQSPNDPGYFSLHNIDLAQVRLLCVKAKNHFRASFSSLCQEIIDCDAPGPASLDLTIFPYRRVPAHFRRS